MNSPMTKHDDDVVGGLIEVQVLLDEEDPEVNSEAVSITKAWVLLDEEDPEVDSEAASITKAC